MNTAVARRLALGDRVVWIGKDDYQPSGPGTITRITPHQVEVRWEDETARRYRRAQLHNLRHRNLVCELHEARAPNSSMRQGRLIMTIGQRRTCRLVRCI
jgi:hypothetical protein